MKGLEPPRREAPDPKSGAATNYATSASLGLFKKNLIQFKLIAKTNPKYFGLQK